MQQFVSGMRAWSQCSPKYFCSSWIGIWEHAGLSGCGCPCCRSWASCHSFWQPCIAPHHGHSLPVLSMRVINGRNCLTTNYRQVQVVTARCLIIAIKKFLEVPGVHFWKHSSNWVPLDFDGFVHCIKWWLKWLDTQCWRINFLSILMGEKKVIIIVYLRCYAHHTPLSWFFLQVCQILSNILE